MSDSRDFLETCYALGAQGCFTQVTGDRKIARGFADLGHELFYLYRNKKLFSFDSGTLSEFPEAHRAFFFTVPSEEDLIDEILNRGFTIARLDFVEQRVWQLILAKDGTARDAVEHRELKTVLARGLKAVLS